MASRMDRYSNKEVPLTRSGRSDRNKSLYKQIEDLDSYTNIAGIATMDSKNEIDIEKVKDLLKSRESNKKELYVEQLEEEIVEEENRNYDINDLLSKVKENKTNAEEKYRSLNEKQKNLLKTLNERNEELKKEEDELEELVKTISNMKAIKEEDIESDDVGLLDDLKSDTMVGDASSIKKIIDEEKELTREFDEMKIDKSFYTSSFGFTQSDFEELKNINHKIKKDNKKIITLLIILIILIVAVIAFFISR